MDPIAVVRKAFEHFNAGEDQQYLALFDPAVVIESPQVPAQLGERREKFEGRAGVTHLIRVLRSRTRHLHAEVEQLVPVDENRVLVLVTMWVETEESSSGTRMGIEYRAENGKITRAKTYATRDEALRAAGLPTHAERV